VTWHYCISDDKTELDVWDHTQDPETDAPLATVRNDGDGLQVTDDVESLMYQEAQAAEAAGNIERWRAIHLRLAAGRIEEATDA
jgi:hypothetical protein